MASIVSSLRKSVLVMFVDCAYLCYFLLGTGESATTEHQIIVSVLLQVTTLPYLSF